MTDHRIEIDGVAIHYLDHPGGAPPLVFLPGLSATAPIFEDLIGAGLSPRFRAVALDLRGRGHSAAPPAGFDPARPAANYTMADHAGDVLGLLDRLGLEQAVLVGHSFGGMLAFYLAANHPGRFPRVVVIDAAMSLASPTHAGAAGPDAGSPGRGGAVLGGVPGGGEEPALLPGPLGTGPRAVFP